MANTPGHGHAHNKRGPLFPARIVSSVKIWPNSWGIDSEATVKLCFAPDHRDRRPSVTYRRQCVVSQDRNHGLSHIRVHRCPREKIKQFEISA